MRYSASKNPNDEALSRLCYIGLGAAMPKRAQSTRESRESDESFRTPIAKTKWFDEAESKIGEPRTPNRVRLAVQLQKFEQAWSQHIPLIELRGKPWQCKQVWDSPACKAYRVYQLTVSRDIRVWFTVVPHRKAAVYLDVEYKQSKSHSSEAITRCCRRARLVWEEEQQ